MPRGSAPGERRGGRKPGTPNKATADVKVLAQQYTTDAIATLASIMTDVEKPPQARVAAANSLLDRGHGKPAQAITGPDGNDLTLTIKKIVDVYLPDAPAASA